MMYLGGFDDSQIIQDSGLETYPAGTADVLGAAFGQAMVENPSRLLWRYMQRSAITAGTPSLGGLETGVQQEEFGQPVIPDLMTAEDANKEYGVPGMVPFSAPVSRQIAESIQKEQQDKRAREVLRLRSQGGLLAGAPGQFAAGLAASALDPVNIATAFIPAVPAARVAAGLAAAGSALGRAGVRAGVGLAEGALGAALVEPIVYGLMRDEHNDYTMGDSALNVVMGAVLGGALHTGVGAVADWRSPQARDVALREAVISASEGLPSRAVETARVADLELTSARLRERASGLDDMGSSPRLEELRTTAAIISTDRPIYGKEYAPETLGQFLARRGGVMEQGGDLTAIGADTFFVPGQGRLVRKNGMALDYAREAAEEAGYLPQNSTIADLLDAIAEEVSGRRVYLPHEVAMAHERKLAAMSDRERETVERYRSELRDISEEFGVKVSDAELDHAVVLTMDGYHPEEALRAATVGDEMSRLGYEASAREEGESLRRLQDADRQSLRERLSYATAEIAALRKAAEETGPGIDGEIAKIEELHAELAAVIDAERQANRLTPVQEKVLRDFQDAADLAEGQAKAYEAAGMCAAMVA